MLLLLPIKTHIHCKFNEYRSKRLAATLVEPTLKTDINGIPNGQIKAASIFQRLRRLKIVNRVSYRTLTLWPITNEKVRLAKSTFIVIYVVRTPWQYCLILLFRILKFPELLSSVSKSRSLNVSLSSL